MNATVISVGGLAKAFAKYLGTDLVAPEIDVRIEAARVTQLEGSATTKDSKSSSAVLIPKSRAAYAGSRNGARDREARHGADDGAPEKSRGRDGRHRPARGADADFAKEIDTLCGRLDPGRLDPDRLFILAEVDSTD